MIPVVPLGLLWILLNISPCATEIYYDLPEDDNHNTTLLEHKKSFSARLATYDRGLSINPSGTFEKHKVWVPVVAADSLTSDCHGYPHPTSVKVARLMLEMFRNLEGNNVLTDNLVKKLLKSKVLLEASLTETVPDFDTLAKTYATFPRIMSLLWLDVTDPIITKNHGWCSVDHMSKYLSVTSPVKITKDIEKLDEMVSEARVIMEAFIAGVQEPLSAESSEHHGRRSHGREQSSLLIKSNQIPGYDDDPPNVRNNQKLRRRRQESHYQSRFEPSYDVLHKSRRRNSGPRSFSNFNNNITQDYKTRKFRNFKMVRVILEPGITLTKTITEIKVVRKFDISVHTASIYNVVFMIVCCLIIM